MNALAFLVPMMQFVSMYLVRISATAKRATLERHVERLWKVSMITIHLYFLDEVLIYIYISYEN